MPYNEAQKNATIKYRNKAYDQMNLQVKKGMKDIYKTQAKKRNMSLNAYITYLIEKDMETPTP